MESLVVNALVEVLDEDVSLTSLAEGGVTLGPHDSARAVLDEGVVEVLEGALTVGSVEIVDVGVSERTTGDGITADSDAEISADYVLDPPGNRADHVEDLKEHGLGDSVVELSDVERSTSSLGGTGSRGGLGLSRSRSAGGSSGRGDGRGRGRSVGHFVFCFVIRGWARDKGWIDHVKCCSMRLRRVFLGLP